ncbi:hypothetical protein OG874_44310 [Nocardia sp. NBC_00565]|uniref:hypothetical protein n=1 Tax=Nocardia sp. NBC_00565 TaxID=2975993 RepID=UPI002E7FE561|nr:hypothetical protein [Nocardia sp. NBC_00565]WUC03587.1 hypothetical protein OG874_44310 [Nocardia sp. NBC_00565]
MFAYRRHRLAELTHFLVHLAPAVETGILAFIDAPGYQVSYTARDLQKLAQRRDIRKVVDELDPAGEELFRQAGDQRLGLPPGTMPALAPESYASIALNGILAGLGVGDAEQAALHSPATTPYSANSGHSKVSVDGQSGAQRARPTALD